MIRIRPAKEFRYPVIAECISPDVLRGKTLDEISSLQAREGNKQRKLSELFKIEEVRGETAVNGCVVSVQGDVSKVRRIGLSMKDGEIVVNGDVGMHLGEEMKGGKITVQGNAGAWAGSMMGGGTIEIHGNAGDYLAAPYRGSTKGMHGGKIVVYGNVGNEAGACMRNGIIKIYGKAGQFTGLRMCEGTIYVQKDCEERAGACMVNGKIVVGGFLRSVLPTFTIDGLKKTVKVEEDEAVEGPLYVFLGDLVEHGAGKLYVSKNMNPHLSHFEKFL